jgi:hypothetical protein
MSIKVSVRTNTLGQVAIKPKKSTVSSINVGARPSLSLGQITNVDASDPDDNEALVYDAATNKYVVKPIVIDSNNITNVAGGTF